MKPDLKTELKELADTITPRAEFLEAGREHLRIQARARRQTTRGLFESTYVARKATTFVFPYRFAAAGAALTFLAVVWLELPTIEQALHGSSNPYLQRAGEFIEQHGLTAPMFDSAETLKEYSNEPANQNATSSKQSEQHKTKFIFDETPSSSYPAAVPAGVRPSVIETLKKVITLPELPTLPNATVKSQSQNTKAPESAEESTTNNPDKTLPENASATATAATTKKLGREKNN